MQARRALLDGDPAEAERLLAGLVARYPGDVELLVALAAARGEGGQLDEARATLVRATALDPKHPRAWYLLGKYAIQSGDARQALDDYLVRALVIQNQLENRQGRADVLNAMGVGAEQLGRLDEAEDHYAKAAALRAADRRHPRLGDDAAQPGAPGRRARPQRRGGGAHRRGAAAAREAAATSAGSPTCSTSSACSRRSAATTAAALDQYRQALQAREALGDKRALAESYNNVGFAYYLLGEYDNASVYWRQALDLFSRRGDKQGAVQARQNLGHAAAGAGALGGGRQVAARGARGEPRARHARLDRRRPRLPRAARLPAGALRRGARLLPPGARRQCARSATSAA